MTKTAKGLLGTAMVCLVAGGIINVGWIDAQGIDALYVIFPVGAVLLGLFLIEHVLEREVAVYEQDQHSVERAAPRPANDLANAPAATAERR